MPLVSGDDNIGLPITGAGQHLIVRGIVFDDAWNGCRCDDFCYLRKALCAGFDRLFRPLEFRPEDTGYFGNNGRGYEEGVGSFERLFPNGTKLALGTCEDGYVDVGIENSSKSCFGSFFCTHSQSFPPPAV